MVELHLHVPDEIKTEIAARAARQGVSESEVFVQVFRSRPKIDWPTPEEVDEEFGAASAEAIQDEPWDPSR